MQLALDNTGKSHKIINRNCLFLSFMINSSYILLLPVCLIVQKSIHS